MNRVVSNFLKHNKGSYVSAFLKCGTVKFGEHGRDTACEAIMIEDISDCTIWSISNCLMSFYC